MRTLKIPMPLTTNSSSGSYDCSFIQKSQKWDSWSSILPLFFPVKADKVPRVLHPRLNENWVSFHSKHLLPVIYHTHEISSSILLPPLKDPIVPPHKSTWENEGKHFHFYFNYYVRKKGRNQQLIWKPYNLCYYGWRNCVKSTWYMTLYNVFTKYL